MLRIGVVVFACEREVAGLMAAVGRRRAGGAFGWLGSDCWAGGALVSAGNERAMEGAIGLRLQANPVRGFREYFLNLTLENNPRNPWFIGNILVPSIKMAIRARLTQPK